MEAVDHQASNVRFGTRYVYRNFVSASSGIDSVYLELSADSAEITTYSSLAYLRRHEAFRVLSDRDGLLKLEHSPYVPGKTILEVYLRVRSTPDSIFLVGMSGFESNGQPDSGAVKGIWTAENPVHGHAPLSEIEISDSTIQWLSPRDIPRPLSLHEDTSFCEGCYVDPKAGVLFKRSGKFLYMGGLHAAGYRKE